MAKSFVYVDPVTCEKFRIFASNGIEAKVKFDWANDRMSDDMVRELDMGFEPDNWELDEVVEITYEV